MFICLLVFLLVAASPAQATGEGWLKWFSPELRRLETQRHAAEAELHALPAANVSLTVPQLGYQHRQMDSPPLKNPWVQVDLLRSQPIDQIVLIPAQVDWQPSDHSAYGFPLEFRVDISDDRRFAQSASIAVCTEQNFAPPGLAPIVFPAGGKRARYVRITVTKLPRQNDRYFFALGELMAISGNYNIAFRRPVRGSDSTQLPPRWSLPNLTDGRTPLGPPIRRDLLPWDAYYAKSGPDGKLRPIEIDLRQPHKMREIRLHPVHARIGLDVPGYMFPRQFRVEVSRSPDYTNAIILFESDNFPNPGNNPVTIRAHDIEAQYLRVVCGSSPDVQKRFGLSEIEVYSEGQNVALGANVDRNETHSFRGNEWPTSLLVDGYTSYGRLMKLPDWFRQWERRQALQAQLDHIRRVEPGLVAHAQRRVAWCGAGFAALCLLGVGAFIIWGRRKREQDLRDLRLRLARNLHDEIGSNLAGMAVLSEAASSESAPGSPQQQDWRRINRIAQETTDALREVLWLIGAREEAGFDLMPQMQLVASRMLAGRQLRWHAVVEQFPDEWPLAARRQVFLFFKETLTNIVRHSRATEVELSARILHGQLQLEIFDNGCGFDPARSTRGIGLASQEKRASAIGANLKIISASGRGTRVCLAVPLNGHRKRLIFRQRLPLLDT